MDTNEPGSEVMEQAKFEVAGISVTFDELVAAIHTLKEAHHNDIFIKQPLARAGNPLANSEYHQYAKLTDPEELLKVELDNGNYKIAQPAFINYLESQRDRILGVSSTNESSDQTVKAIYSVTPSIATSSDPEDVISVSSFGAGFGSSEHNKRVELAALEAVKLFYQDIDGGEWEWEDVGLQKIGWDLTGTHASGTVAKVEVKGVTGSAPIILLTKHEWDVAKTDQGWTLAVVTSALTNPKVQLFTPEQAIRAALPYVFKADLSE
jgi:hypothetical protein